MKKNNELQIVLYIKSFLRKYRYLIMITGVFKMLYVIKNLYTLYEFDINKKYVANTEFISEFRVNSCKF